MAVHIARAAIASRIPADRARRREIVEVTRCCLEVFFGVLDGEPYPQRIPQLEHAAQVWAREGVALETILHAVHAGTLRGVDLVAAARKRRGNITRRTRVDTLAGGAGLIVNTLDIFTTTITTAYVHEIRGASGEHRRHVRNLATALLRGEHTSVAARHCGIPLADDYAVLAVHLPCAVRESVPHADFDPLAQRRLRHIRDELAVRCGHKTLAILSTRGGTILLPANQFDGPELDQLVVTLTRAANTGIVAAVETSARDKVPTTAEHVHQMLDALIRLDYPGGLYRSGQLALEVQLSRPSHARQRLAAMLDPLDANPELLSLLRAHYDNGLDRQRTAQQFHIHTNTLDNRLKRIAQLTGWDPVSGNGAWRLQSALVARGVPISRPPSELARDSTWRR
ncbi:CdaR family transcriptional regulator [Nocardia sp. SYP-A9097]|uniref:PucR family transcriptional regulator n=1 Tax=Nocardia sp. SYP-A9097 TaxID=2663237 RepID=UPI001891AD32|nr:PucR family transcriptional regulator [Nocardia sp. SYP-A9097]